MNDWLLLFAAAVGAGPLQDAADKEPATSSKPNIVFVLADDLGYGDVGCYGQKKIATPNLNRMAAEGIRCTQCYAGSTVCAPSRCVLMTGLHTGHCRVRGNADVPLRPGDVTVAEVLKQAGYQTGIIGKWGLGDEGTTGMPTRQGFDEWFGYLNQQHAHNYYPEFLWRGETKVPISGNMAVGGVARTKAKYSHDLFVDEALSFLMRRRNEPFFLYLALTIPHANNEAGRVLGDGMEVPDYGPYADKDWPVPERGRAAMIHRLDLAVGSVLQKLKDLGIDEKTIVFFSSDNGPHSEGNSNAEFFDSNGPLRGKKRDLYEGGIRVPMIVRWPGKIKAGEVGEYPWGFVDFLPTAAEMAGAPAPTDIDGQSVVPTLLGQSQPPHAPFYWEFHEGGFHQAVRFGDWKGVRRGGPKGSVELYDLREDAGETSNVAGKHPDLVERTRDLMARLRNDSPDFPVKPTRDTPQPKQIPAESK